MEPKKQNFESDEEVRIPHFWLSINLIDLLLRMTRKVEVSRYQAKGRIKAKNQMLK